MGKKNPVLGFLLALTATATWGSLPIAAQQVLTVLDAPTLVGVRFLVAALVLLIWLGMAGRLPKLSDVTRKTAALFALGVLGISANFLLIAQGLHHISPTTTQVLWQLAPFTMIFTGVLLFKDRVSRGQKMGLMLLLVGLCLFFHDKFGELFDLGQYAAGVFLAASGSMVWVCYGVAQKLLSDRFDSQQILLVIYAAAALVFAPFAEPSSFGDIDSVWLWACFAYCCANTLIGYGSYGEALKHWDASKVSIVTTQIPVFTMIFSSLGHMFAPERFAAPDMDALGYAGAFLVVAGAVSAAAGERIFRRVSKA